MANTTHEVKPDDTDRHRVILRSSCSVCHESEELRVPGHVAASIHAGRFDDKHKHEGTP